MNFLEWLWWENEKRHKFNWSSLTSFSTVHDMSWEKFYPFPIAKNSFISIFKKHVVLIWTKTFVASSLSPPVNPFLDCCGVFCICIKISPPYSFAQYSLNEILCPYWWTKYFHFERILKAFFFKLDIEYDKTNCLRKVKIHYNSSIVDPSIVEKTHSIDNWGLGNVFSLNNLPPPS